MPFPPQIPRELTRENVEMLAPGTVGCYGLFTGDACIYIGKGDLRARLLAHLEGDNYCVRLHRPTHWVDVITGYAHADAEERQLVRELMPRCNERVS
jgi:hypothetical protein